MSELAKELDRFRVAYATGLARDIEPISKRAVLEGLALLKSAQGITNCFAELENAANEFLGGMGEIVDLDGLD